MPPLTWMTSPMTCDAAGEARNTATAPTSALVPNRSWGILDPILAMFSSLVWAAWNPLSITPGAIVFTLIPCFEYVWARLRPRQATAALAGP